MVSLVREGLRDVRVAAFKGLLKHGAEAQADY